MADEERADKKNSPLVGLTAQQAVAQLGPIQTDDAERAEEAGVKDAAFIDYEEALVNYENREDVEFLGERRAREFPATFGDADFRREVATVENTGLIATDTTPTATNVPSNVTEEALSPTYDVEAETVTTKSEDDK